MSALVQLVEYIVHLSNNVHVYTVQTVVCYFYIHVCTVESLNSGHIGTDHFVHYKSSFRGKKLYVGASECVIYSECPLSEVPLYVHFTH